MAGSAETVIELLAVVMRDLLRRRRRDRREREEKSKRAMRKH
jgi:hypothetical protein